ncbi:YkgG family uncharacterized protein [Hydrogenispora ethanolica]|uniref:YkgG family uncharacterized protein n=1 Tax=Hydrogenispora ethanolica TaxID=1082276 RepID=A0A4R1R036_HYDET|nr:lactate utilization protein [Hydrogenispora ethanolica]TCL58640.1 YkgG family uncharacterized protein [Hydrogenispora ethanolica]
MNKFRKWQCRRTAEAMVEVLRQKCYDAHYAEDLDEALKMVLAMIPEGSSVAVGGSETLSAMGLVDILRHGNYRFFDRYQDRPFEEIVEIYRQSLLADFLVTGTNALTRQGELVNVDSSGNRVAGMIFGPRRVIVVAGANKVVDDLAGAFKRLKQIAPMNALRNGHQTPCVETGVCMDCQIPARVCNAIGIINHGMKFAGRISVIMVAEEVGF